MKKIKINLDTAAATPLDPRVRKVMEKQFKLASGNPSSIHSSGVAAAQVLRQARRSVACSLSAHEDEIIFTSGGTEANNLAIFGITQSGNFSDFGHIITTVIEHASILEPLRQLERAGWRVDYLSVEPDGILSPKKLARALRPDTRLISIGYANNEIGVIQPLSDLSKVIRQSGSKAVFHTDACQAPRFLDCRVSTLGVDTMSLNGGKIYGPKGVGCLYVRRGVTLAPLIFGGGQERGLRSGTENVPLIAGFATAFLLCDKLKKKEKDRLEKLRDYFIRRLLSLAGVSLNGSATKRLANNINVSFEDRDSEWLVLALDAERIACSAGSACSTHDKMASHVIMAIGGKAENAIRFSLGREINKRQLDYVFKKLSKIYASSSTSTIRLQRPSSLD